MEPNFCFLAITGMLRLLTKALYAVYRSAVKMSSPGVDMTFCATLKVHNNGIFQFYLFSEKLFWICQ